MHATLRKLAEECGELTQAAIKVHDHKAGWQKLLAQEAGDVVAQINKLVALGVIDKKVFNQRVKDKA